VAYSLARDHGAQLILLHVYPPPIAHEEIVARRQPNGFHDQLWNALHNLKAPDASVRVEYQLAEGHPAAEILRAARETPCDLIVMGTHGRTGFRRMLMGSVAEEVLRRAPCPVLTVRGALPEAVASNAPEATANLELAQHA
jgi:nucleotide-binding universal stress UspA family protein